MGITTTYPSESDYSTYTALSGHSGHAFTHIGCGYISCSYYSCESYLKRYDCYSGWWQPILTGCGVDGCEYSELYVGCGLCHRMLFQPSTGTLDVHYVCRNVHSCRLPNTSGTTHYVMICYNNSSVQSDNQDSHADFDLSYYTCSLHYNTQATTNYACGPAYGCIQFSTCSYTAGNSSNCFWLKYDSYWPPIICSAYDFKVVCDTTAAPSGVAFSNFTNITDAGGSTVTNATCFAGHTWQEAYNCFTGSLSVTGKCDNADYKIVGIDGNGGSVISGCPGMAFNPMYNIIWACSIGLYQNATKGTCALTWCGSTGSGTENPNNNYWWNTLTMSHGDGSTYYNTQFAQDFTGCCKFAFRSLRNGTYTPWKYVIDTGNGGDCQSIASSLSINPGSASNWGEGIRINRANNGYTALAFGAAAGSTQGCSGAVSMHTYCGCPGRLYIAYEGSTNNSYFEHIGSSNMRWHGDTYSSNAYVQNNYTLVDRYCHTIYGNTCYIKIGQFTGDSNTVTNYKSNTTDITFSMGGSSVVDSSRILISRPTAYPSISIDFSSFSIGNGILGIGWVSGSGTNQYCATFELWAKVKGDGWSSPYSFNLYKNKIADTWSTCLSCITSVSPNFTCFICNQGNSTGDSFHWMSGKLCTNVDYATTANNLCHNVTFTVKDPSGCSCTNTVTNLAGSQVCLTVPNELKNVCRLYVTCKMVIPIGHADAWYENGEIWITCS